MDPGDRSAESGRRGLHLAWRSRRSSWGSRNYRRLRGRRWGRCRCSNNRRYNRSSRRCRGRCSKLLSPSFELFLQSTSSFLLFLFHTTKSLETFFTSLFQCGFACFEFLFLRIDGRLDGSGGRYRSGSNARNGRFGCRSFPWWRRSRCWRRWR